MGKLIDYTGQKFGEYTVISKAHTNHNGTLFWLCECSCGVRKLVQAGNLRSGNSNSCKDCRDKGRAEFAKDHRYHYLYNTWNNMLQRCFNPVVPNFRDYGARGITVCDEWSDPVSGFPQFRKDMGERPDGHTLDRINYNGNYEPSNCRWADNFIQSRNKRGNKLSVEDVRLIKFWLNEGYRPTDIAKAFGVTQAHISTIKTGTKTAVGIEAYK